MRTQIYVYMIHEPENIHSQSDVIQSEVLQNGVEAETVFLKSSLKRSVKCSLGLQQTFSSTSVHCFRVPKWLWGRHEQCVRAPKRLLSTPVQSLRVRNLLLSAPVRRKTCKICCVVSRCSSRPARTMTQFLEPVSKTEDDGLNVHCTSMIMAPHQSCGEHLIYVV